MPKKILASIICISLVLGSFVPSFALVDVSTNLVDVSTDSAIKLKSVDSVSDVRANGDTVAPVSSTGVSYYWNSSSVSSVNASISKWADIVTWITYSIGYSARYMIQNLNTAIGNVESAVDSVYTRLSYTNSYLDGVEGYIDSIEGSLTSIIGYGLDIKNNTSAINSTLGTSNSYLQSIYNLINSGGLVDAVKIKDNTDNNFSYDYVWKKNYTQTNRTVPWINASGNVENMTINTQTRSILGYISLLADTINYSISYALPLISGNVRGDSDAIADLYNPDMTIYSTKRESLWQDLRIYLSNLSWHLSRLDFVLASDEEIAARQAAADNTDQVVDDFISSTGSGSVSTSDLGEMAAGSSAIKSALSSNASASDAFGVFNNDSSIWDWFTQSNKDSFDNVSLTRDIATYTSYYESYISQVLEGVNENERR